jgi:hypothetical protein
MTSWGCGRHGEQSEAVRGHSVLPGIASELALLAMTSCELGRLVPLIIWKPAEVDAEKQKDPH